MSKKLLKVSSIIIYIIYAYFLVWNIFSPNQSAVYEETNKNSDIVYPGFEIILRGFVSVIVLLLFAVLLYTHIFLRQRKVAIFSSFFAASVLIINDPSATLIAFAFVIFGLVISFFELKEIA